MERTKLPSHVQEWIDILEKQALTDPELSIEYCDKLMQYADEVRSEHVKGFGLFYRGFCYYAQAKLELCMKSMSSALNYLIAVEDWYMTARTYNSMGNIADFQGDLSLAIDCYCKGLSISKEHDLTLLVFSISSNLANIHISLGQLDRAVEMLLFCEQLVKEGLAINPTSHLVIR